MTTFLLSSGKEKLVIPFVPPILAKHKSSFTTSLNTINIRYKNEKCWWLRHGCCPHGCASRRQTQFRVYQCPESCICAHAQSSTILPCILAACQITGTVCSSISLYCHGCFFGLGFVVAPRSRIPQQLVAGREGGREGIVQFQHLLLFRGAEQWHMAGKASPPGRAAQERVPDKGQRCPQPGWGICAALASGMLQTKTFLPPGQTSKFPSLPAWHCNSNSVPRKVNDLPLLTTHTNWHQRFVSN